MLSAMRGPLSWRSSAAGTLGRAPFAVAASAEARRTTLQINGSTGISNDRFLAGGRLHAPRLGPCSTKRFGGPSPAKETRTVTRRKCDRFIQEEELGPTAAAHHRAPPPLIFADADQPRFARPALPQQRLGRRGHE